MKKKNEKMKKINESQAKNVSGGYIEQDLLTSKWNVFDDKTDRSVATGIESIDDARYWDYLYNKRDEIGARALKDELKNGPLQ